MNASTAKVLHPPFPSFSGPPEDLGLRRLEKRSGERPSTALLRRSMRRLSLPRPLSYGWLLGPLLVLVYWATGSATGFIDSRILPAPWVAVTTGIELIEEGRLQRHLLISAGRAAQGLLYGGTAGIFLALLSSLSLFGGYVFDGIVQIKRAIPTLALIPFMILWFGIGEVMKVTSIALLVFVPLYVHTHNALRSIDIKYVELAETLRLSYWQFLRQIVLPGALPGIFLGLRFGVMATLVGLVVVEQFNTTSGIGYMVNLARNYAQADVMLVGLVLYAVLGLLSDRGVRWLEGKALSWRRTLAQ